MLPAHAQTSGDCDLAAGCYSLEPGFFASWPGGKGPYLNVPGGHQVSDCSDQSMGSWYALVIAGSAGEAQAAFNAALILNDGVQPTPRQPAELNEGCTIYHALPAR